jgi:hypothetical protein
MKKIFSVTFSHDEIEALQAADDAAEALNEALLRAQELEIAVSLETRVDLEGEYPDFDDFGRYYTLVKNPFDDCAALDGCVFGWTGQEWETVRKAPTEKLWSLIDCEGLWWICPGFQYVNRVGYLLTKESRRANESDYLYD